MYEIKQGKFINFRRPQETSTNESIFSTELSPKNINSIMKTSEKICLEEEEELTYPEGTSYSKVDFDISEDTTNGISPLISFRANKEIKKFTLEEERKDDINLITPIKKSNNIERNSESNNLFKNTKNGSKFSLVTNDIEFEINKGLTDSSIKFTSIKKEEENSSKKSKDTIITNEYYSSELLHKIHKNLVENKTEIKNAISKNEKSNKLNQKKKRPPKRPRKLNERSKSLNEVNNQKKNNYDFLLNDPIDETKIKMFLQKKFTNLNIMEENNKRTKTKNEKSPYVKDFINKGCYDLKQNDNILKGVVLNNNVNHVFYSTKNKKKVTNELFSTISDIRLTDIDLRDVKTTRKSKENITLFRTLEEKKPDEICIKRIRVNLFGDNKTPKITNTSSVRCNLNEYYAMKMREKKMKRNESYEKSLELRKGKQFVIEDKRLLILDKENIENNNERVETEHFQQILNKKLKTLKKDRESSDRYQKGVKKREGSELSLRCENYARKYYNSSMTKKSNPQYRNKRLQIKTSIRDNISETFHIPNGVMRKKRESLINQKGRSKHFSHR